MKVVLFATTCLHALFGSAQIDSVIYLDEIEVMGVPLAKYSAGTSITSFSLAGSAGLDEVGGQSAINFKTYGNGQLATIALRGTSATHTNVIWNGLQVNSPTLGQTDFSVWPSFLTDQLVIQKGSTSSLFGSGSIGGNVVMENSKFQEDSLLTLKVGIGSFGNRSIGFKAQQNPSDKLRLETRVFSSQIVNNFPYAFDGEEVRQPNAAVNRFGVSQKVSGQIRNHHLFSEVAYAINDRSIQPTVTSASRDQLFTKNLRGVISDELSLGNKTVYSSLGFVGESTAFNDTSITKSQQYIANFYVDMPLSNHVNSKTGGMYVFTNGRSDNYLGIEHDHQYHLFSSFNFSVSKNARLTLNLREAIHQAKTVFVPSLGGEWSIIDDEVHLNIRGQISRGYRVPTFNDQFWKPGGNPDLLPELSLNREVGVDLEVSRRHAFSLTVFRSNVDDWIQWQPVDGIWTPRNIREVRNAGLEFTSLSKLYNGKGFRVELKNEYEYTRSSDEGIENKNQLPYVPKHAFSSLLDFHWMSNLLLVQANYAGERFANLSNSSQSSIDDFLLIDLTASKVVATKRTALVLSFSVYNVFDTSYENLKNTAMPGRNFSTQLTIKY